MQNITLISVAVLVVYTVCLFSFVNSWMLVKTSSYFEITKIIDTIDPSIVDSTTISSDLLQCLSSNPNTFDVESVYFDMNSGFCYQNNAFASSSIVNDSSGSIYYCEMKKSAEEEGELIDRRVTIEGSNYSSCKDVYDDGFRHPGVFKMGGTLGIATNLFAPCNDGWVVFQRRQDGSVNFYRNWDDYVNGFGNKDGEFWLGLEPIHQLTSQGNCELYIFLKAEDDHPVQAEGYARYSHFQVGNYSTNYTLSVSGFSGNVQDSFRSHSGYQFSTKDVDNDSNGGSCAQSYKGGWWYSSCHASNLNGLYLNGGHASYANGIEWSRTWSYYYSLIKVEMRLNCN